MVYAYVADIVCLTDEALFRRLFEMMPEERREKIDRLKAEEEKRRSLSAGALLLYAYEDWIKRADHPEKTSETGERKETVKPVSVDLSLLQEKIALPKITYGKHGKPCFQEQPDLHFSLSHSGTKAFCVIGDEPCGCDVEAVRTVNSALIKRCLHPEEKDRIFSSEDPKEQALTFTRIWTMKESFVKLTGEGMSRSFQSFLADPESRRLEAAGEGGRVRLLEEDDWIYCVCVSEKETEKPE